MRVIPWRIALSIVGAIALVVEAGVAQSGRTVREMSLTLRRAEWIVEDPDGKLLFLPNKIAIVGDRVVVTDPKGPAVLAFDLRTGRRLWRYAREGSGPGEMRAPVIPAWHPDGILVADNDTRRLYLLSPAGRLLSEVPAPMGQFMTALCAFRDRSVLVSVAGFPAQSLIVVRLDGAKATGTSYPFPFSASTSLMAAAIDLTERSDADGCLASRKTEDGMALLGTAEAQRQTSFVEVVRQRPYKPPSEIKDTSDLPIPFSLKSGSDGSEFFVWFGGNTCHSRCIDWYDARTLDYRRSLRLTGNTGIGIRDLALRAGLLVVLGTRDDVPVLAAFRVPIR